MIGTLNVAPAQLKTSAQNFSSIGSAVANLTSQMTSLVQGLSSAWSGEAPSAYINKFNMLNDDIQKLIAMVNEHSADLVEMATVYEGAEGSNTEVINNLSGDVII